MVCIASQRESVNQVIDIVNTGFETSRSTLEPEFSHITNDQPYPQQKEQVEQTLEEVREYRDDTLFYTDSKPPLKNGPREALQTLLTVLEKELVEFRLRLGEQIHIEEQAPDDPDCGWVEKRPTQ